MKIYNTQHFITLFRIITGSNIKITFQSQKSSLCREDRTSQIIPQCGIPPGVYEWEEVFRNHIPLCDYVHTNFQKIPARFHMILIRNPVLYTLSWQNVSSINRNYVNTSSLLYDPNRKGSGYAPFFMGTYQNQTSFPRKKNTYISKVCGNVTHHIIKKKGLRD